MLVCPRSPAACVRTVLGFVHCRRDSIRRARAPGVLSARLELCDACDSACSSECARRCADYRTSTDGEGIAPVHTPARSSGRARQEPRRRGPSPRGLSPAPQLLQPRSDSSARYVSQIQSVDLSRAAPRRGTLPAPGVRKTCTPNVHPPLRSKEPSQRRPTPARANNVFPRRRQTRSPSAPPPGHFTAHQPAMGSALRFRFGGGGVVLPSTLRPF